MMTALLSVRGVPGAEDVTDGSVDYYDTDWENVENGVTEEEMQKCAATACGGTQSCRDNSPSQSDTEEYEIVEEIMED